MELLLLLFVFSIVWDDQKEAEEGMYEPHIYTYFRCYFS